MAIDPKLVSIKKAADLPSGIPTANGEFLYFEDETLMKAEMSDLYDRLESAYLGIITPSSTIPATGSWYGSVLEPGTFSNVTPAITVTTADFDVQNGTANNEVRIIISDGVASKDVRRVKGETGVAGTTDILNVSALSSNYNYADASAARADVPVSYRKYGLQVYYKSSNTWVTEQFIGSNLTGWADDVNWRKPIVDFLNVSALLNNYAFTDSGAARNAIPVHFRKQGLEIKYKLSSGGWFREQFIGADTTSWSTVANWRSTEIVDVINVSALVSNFSIASLADAILLLPVNFRRYGIELRYKSGGSYKSFQYTGGNNLTTDFENIVNWTETGAAGVDEFLTEANQTWTL